jgi:hypothetical protein
MSQQDRFSSYQYGEARTGKGQLVEFCCPTDVENEQVRQFFQENIRTIDIPTTGRVNIEHGGYGKYTRYDIVQHNYAGGGPGEGGGWGYIEVLEIKNPPDGRWGIVVNESSSNDRCSAFSEWETLKDARAAFKKHWGSSNTAEEFPKLQGFKRRVACGRLTPWFYAIGDEQLIGDYAFPEGLCDDPVYRFGKKFVTFDDEGIPAIKTCMGTRFIVEEADCYPHSRFAYRAVYFDDGSCWHDQTLSSDKTPRPIEENEEGWIAEAVCQFRRLLAGKSASFSINFADGGKFTGRLTAPKGKTFCAEGDYFVVVRLKGKKKLLEGWVNEFKPTKETPDIVQYVTQRFAKHDKEVERIEIKQCRARKNGKKWYGVFYSRS